MKRILSVGVAMAMLGSTMTPSTVEAEDFMPPVGGRIGGYDLNLPADQIEAAIACEAASCGNGEASSKMRSVCHRWAASKVKRFMQLETMRVANWRRTYGAGSRVPAVEWGYWPCGAVTGLTGEHVGGGEASSEMRSGALDRSRASDAAIRKGAGY